MSKTPIKPLNTTSIAVTPKPKIINFASDIYKDTSNYKNSGKSKSIKYNSLTPEECGNEK